MDFNIRELADSFSKLLPLDKEKLKLSDIESSGIPFLVRKRITQIVREKFAHSIGLPESKWADLHSSKANAIWNSYLQQMTDLLEIPQDNVNEVLHDAVEFSLKLAVQPRKTIVKTLFEDRDTISKGDVDMMMDQFVANNHLVFALGRYMEKKNKDTLGIDEARQVLKKVDEKLTESHNSLDWMEAVKPIFNVAGPLVSSDYIRVFFEEKEMPRVARKYDMMETEISETDFVEIMSSADLLDLSGFEEDQPALFASEDEDIVESEQVETDEVDEQRNDVEEQTDSSLSEISMDRDEAEEDEVFPEELDDETERATLQQEQQDPYLLELFREDDTAHSDENDPEVQNDGDKDAEAVEPSVELETKNDSKPSNKEVEAIGDTEEEESVSIEEPEGDATDLTDFEEGKLEDSEDISMDEDRNDLQAEMPREKEFNSDEDEPLVEWEDDEEEIEEGSLLDQFMDPDEEPDEELQEESETKVTSIYDELNLSPVEEDEADEETDLTTDLELDDELDEIEFKDEIPFEPNDRLEDVPGDQTDSKESWYEEGPDLAEVDDKAEAEDEDVPMWKSFLERENPDDEPSFYFDEGSDEDLEEQPSFYSDEDEINETPIINISDGATEIDDEIEHLSKWLAPDRDRFLHSIFNDSKLAWEQALIDLTVFDEWKSASKYLENEIFNKNRIDIYSEVAVDFTDYLHSYFMEYKS